MNFLFSQEYPLDISVSHESLPGGSRGYSGMKTFSFFTVLKKFRNVTLSSLILTEGGGGGGEAAEDILIAIKGQAKQMIKVMMCSMLVLKS